MFTVLIENEGYCQEGEQRELRHSTGNARFYIGEFLRIVSTRQHSFTQREYTHTHTTRDRSDDYRQNLQSRFALKCIITKDLLHDINISDILLGL